MVAVAGGILRLLHGVRRQIVVEALDLSAFLETAADVVALTVHRWINLVRDASVPLVLGKADVMRSGAYPYFLVFPFKRRFPDAEMMATGNHGDGLGLLVTKILWAVEKVEHAHRHLQIVLLFV